MQGGHRQSLQVWAGGGGGGGGEDGGGDGLRQELSGVARLTVCGRETWI